MRGREGKGNMTKRFCVHLGTSFLETKERPTRSLI